MSHDPNPATGGAATGGAATGGAADDGAASGVTAEAVLVQIGEILHELLGRRIDPDENYFEAGLDSLTVVKFGRLISVRLNLSVPVTSLFEHPNLRDTAALLANARLPLAESAVGRSTPGRGWRAGGSRREIRASIRRGENWRPGGGDQERR